MKIIRHGSQNFTSYESLRLELGNRAYIKAIKNGEVYEYKVKLVDVKIVKWEDEDVH